MVTCDLIVKLLKDLANIRRYNKIVALYIFYNLMYAQSPRARLMHKC